MNGPRRRSFQDFGLGSEFRGGPRGSASIGQDELLAMMGDTLRGDPIAVGVDNIVATVRRELVGKMASRELDNALDELARELRQLKDPKLYHHRDGSMVVVADGYNAPNGHGSPDDLAEALANLIGGNSGLSFEQFDNARRYSDRHGGSGFTNLDRSVFFSRGRVGEDHRTSEGRKAAAEDLSKRMQALSQKAAETPMAPIFAMTFAFASAGFLAYSRNGDRKVLKIADDLAGLLEKSIASNPERFRNLSRRLRSYGYHLEALAPRVRKFAGKPMVGQAKKLSAQLAGMVPTLICVMQDVIDEMTTAAKI